MDLPSNLRPFAAAAIPFAAVIAFASSPLIRFADPTWVWAGGYSLALGLALILLWATVDVKAEWAGWIGGAFFLVGAAMLFRAGDQATTLSKANDRRCLTIQQDMLSAHPRLPNGHDIFQALGCQPQGTEDQIRVPPTDRERLAQRPLPWGGYPPSP